MNTICVIDFETTGMEDDDGIVEIGWANIEGGAVTATGSALCDPGVPIKIEAMACHHITAEMIEGATRSADHLNLLFGGAPRGTIFAAHNVAFDGRFAGRYGPAGAEMRPWLCTLKAARRVWPDAPGHSNQVLRYWLGLGLDPARCEPAHRAGADAYVTAHILLRLMEHASVEDMLRWTSEPSLLARMPFGKHKGTPFSEMPRDYLGWIMRQADIDPDVRFTAERTLAGGSA